MSTALDDVTRVYREHFDYVWSTLRRLGVHESVVEDAAHDVFVVVHRRYRAFEGRSALRTWLFGICRRIAHRHRRGAFRARRRVAALTLEPSVVGPAVGPDEHVAWLQAWQMLGAFLDELDADKRAAFVLGELECLERTQLGLALGINPNTAYSRLRLARERFRERFAEAHADALVERCRRDQAAPEQVRQRVWIAVVGSVARPLAASLALAAFAGIAVVGMLVDATVPRSEPSPGPPDPFDAGAPAYAHRLDHAPVPSVNALVDRPRRMPSHRRSRRAPESAPATVATPTTVVDAPTAASTIAEEAALIRGARRALVRGDTEAASQLLRTHRERFGEGALAAEREAIWVRAQCSAGRIEQARSHARDLLGRSDAAAYLHALRTSCVADVIRIGEDAELPRR